MTGASGMACRRVGPLQVIIRAEFLTSIHPFRYSRTQHSERLIL